VSVPPYGEHAKVNTVDGTLKRELLPVVAVGHQRVDREFGAISNISRTERSCQASIR